MRSTLKAFGLVAVGILIAIFCLFTVNCRYIHTYQTPTPANQREITLSIQPFFPSPVIDLFGGGK